MSFYKNCWKGNLGVRLERNPKIKELDKFVRQLERDYFAEVQVRNCSRSTNNGNLIIELECGLTLAEVIYFIKDRELGITDSSFLGLDRSNFKREVRKLNNQNNFPIDVEEFSIFLKNTSIIIKKIYNKSIEEQLCNLLNSIADHHRYYTNDYKETPYEIYVPVFEEDIFANEVKVAAIEKGQNEMKDYFSYWGLYFDSQPDGFIYDLKKRKIVNGDLLMLDH